jgi:alpha-tubulin suppressor-like RCC1 family protein
VKYPAWSPGGRQGTLRPGTGIKRHLAAGLSALIGTGVLLVGTTALAPASVPAALAAGPTYIDIDAGHVHSCAILADHTVVCWGYNHHGEIGDGSTTDRLLPTTVSGITTAASVDAGYFTSCAVLSDHTIRCWGSNEFGQIGDGTTFNRLVPVTVSGISTATAVSTQGMSTPQTSRAHACALLSNHTVRCWGANDVGQLGDGTATRRLTPVTVSGISTATAIDAGSSHTCALLDDGTVRCWGANDAGQLGDGTTTGSLVPVTVSGITTATAIDAGKDHTCALLADGTVECWGANDDGQLGDGTKAASSTPWHLCHVGRPHPGLLGVQLPWPARRRNDHAELHAGRGERHLIGGERQSRRVSHVCARRRPGGRLGRELLRPAR